MRLQQECKQLLSHNLRFNCRSRTGIHSAVLWLDMDGEREQLHMLHQQVGVEMDKLGFSQEAREYHPHITTARQYQGEAAIEIEKLREQLGSDRPIWKVDKLVLYRTRLGHSPMYEVVGEAPFIAAKT